MPKFQLPIPLQDAEKRIPSGTYLAMVESWKEAPGVEGATKLVWSFQLLDGEYQGTNIFSSSVLSPKALWRTARLCRACSIPVEGNEFDPDLLVNRRLRIVVRESEFQGQPINEVTNFMPESGD